MTMSKVFGNERVYAFPQADSRGSTPERERPPTQEEIYERTNKTRAEKHRMEKAAFSVNHVVPTTDLGDAFEATDPYFPPDNDEDMEDVSDSDDDRRRSPRLR